MNKENLILDYFSNNLSNNDKQELESLLKEDAEFKAQFDLETNLAKAIKSHKGDILKEKLKGFEKDLTIKQPKKTATSVFNYKNFAIAASVALLLGWFGYQSVFSPSYSNLYQDNFSTYPNTVYTITRGDTYNSLEREAFVAYESKDYKTAIEKLDAISLNSKKPYFNFYKAQAYLNLNDITNAKAFFVMTIQENNSFVAESNWYLALIYLKENDKEEATKYLNNLVSNYDYNKEKALQILKKLN